jgi:DNA-binding GntR family transcriptional regulator
MTEAHSGRKLERTRPVIVSSMHMAVRDQLSKDILAGRFPAGSRLQQSELARRYGVSITPIREALRDLTSEGLVDFGAFSGAVVHAPTVAELHQVYEVRARLYPLAMSSAVGRIPAQRLDEAEHLVREMTRSATTAESWAMQNRQLHRILDGATENRHLADILNRLADISALYVSVSDRGRGRRSEADEEHKSLIGAFRRGDVEAATRISLVHIGHTLEQATAVLQGDGSVGGMGGTMPDAANRARQGRLSPG